MRATWLRQGRIALVLATLFAAAVAVSPSAGAGTVPREYRGTFVADPAATVAFRVERKGARRFVVFEADNVEMACDDGTVERVNIVPDAFPLRRDGLFRGIHYSNTTVIQGYYEVKGRLLGGGRAKGSILLLGDYLDHPSFPPGSGIPDCSTFGRRTWSAERVG